MKDRSAFGFCFALVVGSLAFLPLPTWLTRGPGNVWLGGIEMVAILLSSAALTLFLSDWGGVRRFSQGVLSFGVLIGWMAVVGTSTPLHLVSQRTAPYLMILSMAPAIILGMRKMPEFDETGSAPSAATVRALVNQMFRGSTLMICLLTFVLEAFFARRISGATPFLLLTLGLAAGALYRVASIRCRTETVPAL